MSNDCRLTRLIIRLFALSRVQHDKVCAFTLAEVLITLAIIGVVAAMTIPTLMQKTDERETISKLKKHYSELAQAYSLAKVELGTPDDWIGTSTPGSQAAAIKIGNVLTEKMKILKTCNATSGCWANVNYKKLDGSNISFIINSSNVLSKYILADGTCIAFYSRESYDAAGQFGHLEKIYGSIFVDINGAKSPNIWGRDAFLFFITNNGIISSGVQSITKADTSFPGVCNKDSCTGNCQACVAWVIYNDNMDYLHCSGLSWEGKRKCN